jgi:hypothetical protein
MTPIVREYIVSSVMGEGEVTVVSVPPDEFVDVIAEMEDCSTQKDDDPVDCDTQCCSSDEEIMYTEDEDEAAENGGDDHSLTEGKYIRSSPLSGDAELETDEPVEDEGTQNTRVRFATDAKGKVLCQIYISFNCIPEGEYQQIWYSRNDFKRFRTESRKEAAAARKSSYVKDFLKVYEACKSFEKMRSLKPRNYTAVSGSKYRGYEAAVIYNIIRAGRKGINKQVLELQQQHVSCNIMTPEERAEELWDKSRNLSKVSRRLAHVLGKGDSDVARQMVSNRELKKVMADQKKWKPVSVSEPSDLIFSMFEI